MTSLLACMQAHQFYYLGVNTAMFRIVQAKGSFTNVTLLLMFVIFLMIYTEVSRMSHIYSIVLIDSCLYAASALFEIGNSKMPSLIETT